MLLEIDWQWFIKTRCDSLESHLVDYMIKHYQPNGTNRANQGRQTIFIYVILRVS